MGNGKKGYPVSYTDYESINEDTNVTKVHKIVDFYNGQTNLFPHLINECIIATPTVMIKKNIVHVNSPLFDQNIKDGGEDIMLWIQLSYNYKMIGIDKVLTLVNVNNKSYSMDTDKMLSGLINILKYSICNFRMNLDAIDNIQSLNNDIMKLVIKSSKSVHVPKKFANNTRTFYLFGFLSIGKGIRLFKTKTIGKKVKYYLFGILLLKIKSK